MIATGVDIESTGIDFLSGHKIIEIAMVKYEIETQAMVDSFVMRFNPRRSIDPKAQAVHGICLEDLAAEPLLAVTFICRFIPLFFRYLDSPQWRSIRHSVY